MAGKYPDGGTSLHKKSPKKISAGEDTNITTFTQGSREKEFEESGTRPRFREKVRGSRNVHMPTHTPAPRNQPLSILRNRDPQTKKF